MIKLKNYLTILAITLFMTFVSNAARQNIITFQGIFKPASVENLAKLVYKTNILVEVGERTMLGIHSPGGRVDSLHYIMPILERSDVPIDTYIHSFAASAAAMMFLVGERRVMREGSIIMFHYTSIWGFTSHKLYHVLGGTATPAESLWATIYFGGRKGIEKWARHMQRMDKVFKRNLAQVVGQDSADKLLRHGYDIYLNAQEALAAGVATRVIK